MSRLGIALLVLLVLMAGCSGFSDGNGAPDREPYGVDERISASIDENEEELLPGLTTEGLTNTTALREVHEEAIGNQSYTIESKTEYVTEDGNKTTREGVEVATSVDPEAEVIYEVQEYSTDDGETDGFVGIQRNQTIKQWIGEKVFVRIEYEDGTIEYMPAPSDPVSVEDRLEQTSLRLLDPLQYPQETTTIGVVDSEEGTYYVVEDRENRSNETSQVIGGQLEEIDVRMLIREDGLIRQTIAERLIAQNDKQTAIEQTIEITAINETTVERPNWDDEALKAQSENSTQNR